MPANHCVVVGCDTKYTDRVTLRHRFPKDDAKLFKIWVLKTGNNELLNKSIEEVYHKYIICDKHFNQSCRSSGFKKLNKNAVPTLNLPDIIEIDSSGRESTNGIHLMNESSIYSALNVDLDEGVNTNESIWNVSTD